MRWVVVLLFALSPAASLAENAKAKEDPKPLSGEASKRYKQAEAEKDPAKARALTLQACDGWVRAYAASQDFMYQYSLGICYQQAEEIRAAAAAYRTFLASAPATHPLRLTAEQALSQVEAERAAEDAAPMGALVLDGPLPVTVQEEHPWRKPLLLSGGLALGGSVLALVLLRGARQPSIPEGQGGEAEELR